MDNKGQTIAIATFPGKTIIRTNEVVGKNKEKKDVCIFGVRFYSWHAEMRIVHYLSNNRRYAKIINEHRKLELTVLRYTRTGKFGKSSKPCNSCLTVLRHFKEKVIPKATIIISYIEDGEVKKITI